MSPAASSRNREPAEVIVVRVASFAFSFESAEPLRACLKYYEQNTWANPVQETEPLTGSETRTSCGHTDIASGRSATHMKQVEAQQKWNPSELPKWLDEEYYRREILPKLAHFTIKKIRTAIDVTHPYAALIRKGMRIPHPRHWKTLAQLTGIEPNV